MQTIVISGVNLTEGGILSILIDCLEAFKQVNLNNDYRIVVLVHSKKLVDKYVDHFEIREFPDVKPSWRKRLKFEFFDSKKISEELKPDLWFSLHDITPNVNCKTQVVYCHNPSPFYDLPLKDFWLNYKFTLFNIFYGWLYAVNIKKNKYVIIQQNWLRKEFLRRYGVETIVAYPQFDSKPENLEIDKESGKKFMFFYPSLPRVFKNFEVILKATELLTETRSDFKLTLTIDGSENVYSRRLVKRFGHLKNVEFIGVQPRAKIFELYGETDYLIFPSKLETWGLPVSEAKSYQIPILISDLEYAHENIGDYKKVNFFDPDNFIQLADLMDRAIHRKLLFDLNTTITPEYPFFDKWSKLLTFLLLE